MSPAARPIRGLHHFAWRCRDAEATHRFHEDVLGLPLVHVIRKDHVPGAGLHPCLQHGERVRIEARDAACSAPWTHVS